MANLRTLSRAAYQSTARYQYDRLAAEQSKWQRRMTIASNKLAQVRTKMDRLALALANDASGIEEGVNDESL